MLIQKIQFIQYGSQTLFLPQMLADSQCGLFLMEMNYLVDVFSLGSHLISRNLNFKPEFHTVSISSVTWVVVYLLEWFLPPLFAL